METRSVLSNECVQPNSTIKHSLRVSGTCFATWGSTDTCVLPRGMFRLCYTVLFIRPANRTRPSLREETLDLTSKYTLKSSQDSKHIQPIMSLQRLTHTQHGKSCVQFHLLISFHQPQTSVIYKVMCGFVDSGQLMGCCRMTTSSRTSRGFPDTFRPSI